MSRDGRQQRPTLRTTFLGKDFDRLSARGRLRFDLVSTWLMVLLVTALDVTFTGGDSLTGPLVLGPVFSIAALIRYWMAWPP